MINEQLINPKSIVVVGGSNELKKPGGKVLYNIIRGGFKGNLYAINPKETEVQGVKSYANAAELPETDLAILAIPAAFTVETVEILAKQKNTKAFIILSAGFSEVGDEGKLIEDKVVEIINSVDGALIGPNGIGVLTQNYHGVFTEPIPALDPKGADFISGSGATAVFILESAVPNGLSFSRIFSVGNSAQTGVEEVLEYMDETFDPEKSSRIKLLYLENIDKPQKLLKHAQSLIQKGCRIAAIKSGSSEAGSRAASSHTGALSSSDAAVDALFRKAGIVRCYGRNDLAAIGSVFTYPELTGKRIAIITHAGGPAVMLTDALSAGGLEVPAIEPQKAEPLKARLFPGSSVANPIDFLATGTAEQLGDIIDTVNHDFDNIDAMVVIFGTPGLFKVFDAYDVLHQKMKQSPKPIYPVLPSITVAGDEVKAFIDKGHVNFPDEVILGDALARVFHTTKPQNFESDNFDIDAKTIREVIDNSENGYLAPEKIQAILDAAGISRAKETTAVTLDGALSAAENMGYPIVMKVVGPVHKSDVGGVVLGIKNANQLEDEFIRMSRIKGTTGILLQPFLAGKELFVGASHEDKFGHTVLFGMGGIFIEILKDVRTELVPFNKQQALEQIRLLKSYPILEGVRGQKGINSDMFAENVARISTLLEIAPEIKEMDLNPLLGDEKKVIAVDARIRIEK